MTINVVAAGEAWPHADAVPPGAAPASDAAPLFSLAGTWEWDFATGSMTWCRQLCAWLGLSADVPPSHAALLQRILPEDRARLDDELGRAIASGAPMEATLRVIRPDGGIRHAVITGEVYRDGDDRPSWAAGVFIDVTAMREAECDLALREERNAVLAAVSGRGVWRAGADGRLLDAPSWMEITGQTREECRGFGWLLAIHPDDMGEVASTWREALRIGSTTEISFRARHAGGGYRWLSWKAVPLLLPDGQVREWIGCIEEIQARREAEESGRLRDAWLRLAADAARVAIWDCDFEGRTGAPADPGDVCLGPESRLTTVLPGDIHPEDATRVLNAMQRLRDAGERCDQEFRVLDGDGGIRWMHVRAELLRDARAGTGHVVGIAQDVTEASFARLRGRKEAAALLQVRAKFEALAGLAGTMTWTADPTGEMTDMPGWSEVTGQSPVEARGWGWLAVIHPADRERVRRAVQRQTETRVGHDIEFRVRGVDGGYRWLISRSAPVARPDGTVVEWVGVCKIAAVPSAERLPEQATVNPLRYEADELQLVSGAQVRAARGLLRWGVRQLAEAAGVSSSTIRRIEADNGVPESRDARLLQVLRATMEQAGVQFFLGPDGSGAVSPCPTPDTRSPAPRPIDGEISADATLEPSLAAAPGDGLDRDLR